ncbi:hypothetical protein TD95_005077 [Thielaviopsis punctulata]|uniref:Peptidase A1 domain-containing protein n=1 Tax=Thielaviopsis punctulata TaxID=72032 RepID=A0A0F4ZJE1_9PEZI|nr:hypothetical protein TD95_005077 [Thielaviopsis punctulata]
MVPSVNNFLLAALTVAGVAMAAPTASNNTGYSVEQVANPNYIKSAPLALVKAYKKYGKAVPANLQAAADRAIADFHNGTAKRATGSATNTPESSDSEWLTPVQIGTPAQTLNLDFDTGSSDLWVFSTSTPDNSGHSVYNPSRSSSSSLMSGESWSISYGDGSSSSGVVYSDIVSVGGLAVKGQAVEAATKISSEFSSETDLDGLMGLAFSSINTVTPNQQKTFWANALGSMPQGLFTADLNSAKPGKYNFGFIDESAYTGSIGYADVDTSEGFWTFTADNYYIGSSKKNNAVTGIADTGTTLLLLSDSIVRNYYRQIRGARYSYYQGAYIAPCSANWPDFSFTVGGTKITIPSDYMNFGAADNSGYSCYGGLQSSSDIGINIFGDIALKAAFVVFDGENTRLGWANKNL